MTDSGVRPLLDGVRKFAFPRAPGGEGERRAGDLVQEEMEAAGLHVAREPFRAARHAVFRLRLLAQGGAAIVLSVMVLVAPEQPGAAAMLGGTLLLLFAGAARWPRTIEGAFDIGESVESENIVGTRPGRGGDALRIVVMAHRDTKSSWLPTFVPAVIQIATALFVLAVALLALGAWGRGEAGPALLPFGVLLAALLVAVVFNRSGDDSPGAMDNASGVAVLLAAARDLSDDAGLAGTELCFLCTGAEEIGLAGALRWIQAHEAETDPRRTVFLNLDSVGVGRVIHAVDVRGFAPGGRAMGVVLREAARAARVPLRHLWALPAAGVDTMPIGARGFATITLMGEVLGGASRRIHSARDTVEHLNEAGLENARRLVREIARAVTQVAPR